MKFSDLDFRPHSNYPDTGIHAKHFFSNGYGVSVVRFTGLMTADEFYDNTMTSYREDAKGERFGQFFMTNLYFENNSLYQNLPESVDCFYDDKLFPKFIEWVYNNW